MQSDTDGCCNAKHFHIFAALVCMCPHWAHRHERGCRHVPVFSALAEQRGGVPENDRTAAIMNQLRPTITLAMAVVDSLSTRGDTCRKARLPDPDPDPDPWLHTTTSRDPLTTRVNRALPALIPIGGGRPPPKDPGESQQNCPIRWASPVIHTDFRATQGPRFANRKTETAPVLTTHLQNRTTAERAP